MVPAKQCQEWSLIPKKQGGVKQIRKAKSGGWADDSNVKTGRPNHPCQAVMTDAFPFSSLPGGLKAGDRAVINHLFFCREI